VLDAAALPTQSNAGGAAMANRRGRHAIRLPTLLAGMDSIRSMSKAQEISEIARLVDIADPGIGVGSSVFKDLFDGICERFQIASSGTMPEQAQRIVTAANLPYRADFFDSRVTPSGGGSTVTLEGLQQIRRAVQVLLG